MNFRTEYQTCIFTDMQCAYQKRTWSVLTYEALHVARKRIAHLPSETLMPDGGGFMPSEIPRVN